MKNFHPILSQNSELVGIIWMLLHCFFVSLIVTLAKFLGQKGFSSMQIIFFHSFIALMIISPVAFFLEGKSSIQTKKLSLHLLRGVLGTLSLFLYFFALKHMPLTDARAIALFYPIITFIFAILFSKEYLDFKQGMCLIVSLIGGWIILNPTDLSFHKMSFFILAGMVMWGVNDLIIKSLSTTESTIKQLFYQAFFFSLFSFPLALLDWKSPETMLEITLLSLLGIIFLLNSLALFWAIKYAKLTTIMPFDFSGMIFTALFSFFIFSEVIKWHTMLGAFVVFISSCYLIMSQHNKQ